MAISARALRFGRAVIELGLTTKDFEKQLGKLKTPLQKFTSSLRTIIPAAAAMGTAIAAAVAVSIKAFTQLGSEIKEFSQKTGFSTEAISKLRYAAGETGASLADVATATKGMARFLLNAQRGSSAATNTLDRLGVTLGKIRALGPEDQFRLLARRISAVQDPTTRAALAMQAFGKAGTSLLPMIAEFDDVTERAERFAAIMTQEDVEAADRLDDAIFALTAQFEKLKISVGGVVVGPLSDLVDMIQEAIDGIEYLAGTKKDPLQKLNDALKNPVGSIVNRPKAPDATRSQIINRLGLNTTPFIGNRFTTNTNTGFSSRLFQGFRDAVAAGQVKVEAKLMRARFELQKHGVMDAIEAIRKKMDSGVIGGGIQREGIFSTRFASQIFGGSNPQTVLLAKIERNTRVKGKEGIRVV